MQAATGAARKELKSERLDMSIDRLAKLPDRLAALAQRATGAVDEADPTGPSVCDVSTVALTAVLMKGPSCIREVGTSLRVLSEGLFVELTGLPGFAPGAKEPVTERGVSTVENFVDALGRLKHGIACVSALVGAVRSGGTEAFEEQVGSCRDTFSVPEDMMSIAAVLDTVPALLDGVGDTVMKQLAELEEMLF